MIAALFYIFLISTPFGYRVLLHQWTFGFDEYESAFFYANDILLILFLCSLILFWRRYFMQSIGQAITLARRPYGKWKIIKEKFKKLALSQILLAGFLFFAFISIFWAALPQLAFYNFVRLSLLVMLTLSVSDLLKNKILNLETIFGIIAGLAVIESLIGFLQFLFQHSLGLERLGEPVLGPNVVGTAKIIVEGAPIIRAYGTFPHPNVLGAFLILGLLSLCYLWFNVEQYTQSLSSKFQNTNYKQTTNFKTQIINVEGITKTMKRSPLFGNCDLEFIWNLVFVICIFVILVGIVLTFSRAAWIVASVISIVIILRFIFSKHLVQSIRLAFMLFVTCLMLLIIFWPFVFPRAQISREEPAVSYRLSYNWLGINLIGNNPFGVGLGNQVIYSVKNHIYQKAGMKQVWEWQPIHNIYLLMATEIGILGLLSFLIFIFNLILNQFKIQNSKFKITVQSLELENTLMILMLAALLIFGLSDHFLWTLEPGRLMLWIVIGMVMGADARSTYKEMRPSFKTDASVGFPTSPSERRSG